ncbi:hypothetical protein [Pseudomonas iridis]|uniref:hypothetical protein n=1 Tax=Pseudomonas iridis TaxID=2710587 RepID=UPI001B33F498|nr:hypothetical protein [Pseudomonas iridis]MBP5971052.1 hypothetical protein [Pseudomonas iridis]
MEFLPKARQVLVVSTGPWASIQFGFWSFVGAMAAFGAMVTVDQLLTWGWPLLRTWWGF